MHYGLLGKTTFLKRSRGRDLAGTSQRETWSELFVNENVANYLLM